MLMTYLLQENHGAFIKLFLHTLSMKFSIEDLGALHYFLSVEAIHTPTSPFLT